jgi:hypothetical protein
MIGAPVFRYVLTPGWAGDSLARAAQAVPSLDLNFAVTKNLGPLVTFTRASSATFIDSAGTLQTAAVDVPRFDHNPTTGESLGLLVEEARTNLLLNTATLSTQSVTVTAVAHTLSFYGSGTVTLSGASTAGPAVGSGAFPARTTLTFTPSAGTLTLTVTGSATSAQLEAGAFPTSYIPTTTAAATRSADVASITGANFSSWYRQDEGTVFAQCVSPATTLNIGVVGFDDTTANERWRLGQQGGSTTANVVVVDNNVLQGNTGAPINSFINGSLVRIAAAVAVNNVAVTGAGLSPTVNSTATLPTVTQATIGTANAAVPINGTIRRLTYWPQRLPNSTLQAITQ